MLKPTDDTDGHTDLDSDAAARGLADYIIAGIRRVHEARPVSFYLLPAIIVFLLASAPATRLMEEPAAFAGLLSAHFVFFFFVMAAAIRDCRNIVSSYWSERSTLYRATLGDTEFMNELRTRATSTHGAAVE